MKLSILTHRFFDQYLPNIKGASENTTNSYRNAFTVFLPFAAKYHGVKVNSLKVDHISFELIIDFLDHLQKDRKNIANTRNQRLAALKSFAKMIQLIYQEHKDMAEMILNIPQKKTQKTLIGFLSQEEILKLLDTVDINKPQGMRDYTILHLLFDSGARATEIATLNLDSLDYQKKTLAIMGKGNRYRIIELWPKTVKLIKLYITKHRATPKLLYKHRLFINQRGGTFTRNGIYRMARKHLTVAFSKKRLECLDPAHCFRHSCAMSMFSLGHDITEIKNRLGHENIQTTMTYLHIDLSNKKEVQKKFTEYTQSLLKKDPKIDSLLDWENKEKTLAWLDSL